jgi:hypothetical protein
VNPLQKIWKRFPVTGDARAVFGVAVLACYSWLLRGFFEKLPSFMLYFRVGDLLAIFAYMMTVALLESLLVTGFLAAAAAVLPQAWLKNGFSYKGFILVAVGALAMLRFQKGLTNQFPALEYFYINLGIPLLLAIGLMLVVCRFPRLQSILLDLLDRISILSYIYVPVGIISLLVVIVRLVF